MRRWHTGADYLHFCLPRGSRPRAGPQSAGLHRAAARRSAQPRMAHERRQPLQSALFAAGADQSRQRRAPEGGLARLAERLGPRAARSGNQAQPLVYDGVVYIMTGENDVFAVSVDTGKVLWEYKANIDPKVARPCCSWVGRGLGLGEGKVFVGQLDAKLVALDQQTGKVRWSIQAEDPQGRLRHRQRPALLRRHGHHGLRRKRHGHARAHQGVRREDRQAALDLLHRARPRRARPRNAGRRTAMSGSTAARRSGRRPPIDPELGLIYFSTANPGPVLNGNLRAGRQSLQRLDPRAGGEDRQIPLALPAGSPRHLGLRLAQSRHPVRCDLRRTAAQGHRASRQDRLGLHPRSRDRQAAASASSRRR